MTSLGRMPNTLIEGIPEEVSMRRFLFGLAIATITATAPMTAMAGDREIADAIVTSLKQKQTEGSLKGFDIDLTVNQGQVILSGKVGSEDQLAMVLATARSVTDVKEVVNQMKVTTATTLQPAQDLALQMAAPPAIPTPVSPAVKPASTSEGDVGGAIQTAATKPTASASDAAITDQIIDKLTVEKSAGALSKFDLDVSTVGGEVWARGWVVNPQHKQKILQAIQSTSGVQRVIDDISIVPASRVQAASSMVPQDGGIPGVAVPGVAIPGVEAPIAAPRAFAPSTIGTPVGTSPVAGVGGPVGGMVGQPGPVPMAAGPSYGGGVPRYDQPNMPSYAWPSYAAYPNYAAVTYPKQYSATAWPYIGPFYPYPQVPLGWRRVSLEWDDGLWYLDFSSKPSY
jgi:osmotically-inducible protein OsmY